MHDFLTGIKPCFTIFFLLLYLPLFSQTSVSDSKPGFHFESLGEGLNNSEIKGFCMDRYGFLWIGTKGGLHVYDGVEMRVYLYDESDSTSIPDNVVTHILEDSRGSLWIVTWNGIARYNRALDHFERYVLYADVEKEITGIVEDNSGIIWVAGRSNGLFFFNAERNAFEASIDFPYSEIGDIQMADSNQMWLAVPNKIVLWDITKKKRTEYKHPFKMTPTLENPNFLIDLLVDSKGRVWLGTFTEGLFRMEIEKDSTTLIHYNPKKNNIPDTGTIFFIHEDPQGRIWVSCENIGLFLYDEFHERFYKYEREPSDPSALTNNSIWSIYSDQFGRIWLGSGLKGVSVIDPLVTRFKHYSASSGGNALNSNVIRGFHEDDHGNIWIATDGGGINVLNRQTGQFHYFVHSEGDPSSIAADAVLAFCEDNDKNLWAGTWAGGINILKNYQDNFISERKIVVNQFAPDIKNAFHLLKSEHSNHIWISAYHYGLIRYNVDNGEMKHYVPDQADDKALSSVRVHALFEDRDGNIWIPTSHGLNLLTPENQESGEFRVFVDNINSPGGLPHREVWQVTEDDRGNIWLATGNGLARYLKDKDIFEVYRVSDGLPSNEIRSLIFDNEGNLWMGTTKGLSMLDVETMSFHNFDRSNGLQGDEFSRFSAFKLSSGELLFGGIGGFNIFYPDQIVKNSYPPNIVLTDFKIYNQSVRPGGGDSQLNEHISVTESITLEPWQEVFTIDFIATNLTKAYKNEYAFKLEGLEKHWNFVGTRTNATYTSLDPGEYVFRLKAANNNGVWTDKELLLNITVLPYWFETAWFKSFFMLFVLAVAFTAYVIRVRNIKQQNDQLEGKINARTHELGKINDQLQQKAKELKRQVEELDQFAHIVSYDLKSPLRTIKSLSEKIEEEMVTGREEELNKKLTILEGRVEHMSNLIDAILSYSRTGKEKLDIRTINIRTIVEEAIRYIGVPDKFQVHIAENIPDIKSSESLLKQVLINLIGNAVSYHHKSSGAIYILYQKQDAFHHFGVADDGSGIISECHEKKMMISLALQQGDKKESTRVGSAIVTKIIEELGGTTWIESGKEKGSTFWFTLPDVE